MKNKATHSSLDRISNLPSGIIENILCFLPIKEAARTSILSKEWRYNWTKIPKLVFNEDEFEFLTCNNQLSILEQTFEHPPSDRKQMSHRCQVFSAIYQVLLVHQGPIIEFALSVDADETCVEIDQIIAHLSRNNAVKKFMLDSLACDQVRVPFSIFSLHQLTHLHLRNCDIKNIFLRPTSSGFVNLTNLYLEDVDTGRNSVQTIIRLISKSSLLKSFSLILKQAHLMFFRKSGDPTIFDLFELLPVIEHLTVTVFVIECYAEGVFRRQLPTSLFHLKYFSLEEMCHFDTTVPFIVCLIRSSPNLEKLKLEILADPGSEESYPEEDYSDILLEHLYELEVENFENLEHQWKFVKLILAKSPVLKKVSILLDWSVAVNKKLEVKQLLLHCPCASRLVDIIVEHPSKDEDNTPEDDDSSSSEDENSSTEDADSSQSEDADSSTSEDNDSSPSEDEDSS